MTLIDPAQIKEYPNPLDNFRSYSYQYILTLSSTTQAFRDMIGADPNAPAPLLSAVNQAKRLGDPFQTGSSTAYLIVDTRRFSQYSITRLEMEHVYGTGNANNPTVPVNTTQMTLIDTTGMSFFNMLMDVFRNKLQTTRSSAFFLLTIMFVGHKDDGTTEVISTCFIPLMMLTMGFELDARGSEYNIEFMEMEGAPARGAPMEIMNHLGDVQSISTKNRTPTLGGLISALETQLNIQSLAFFQKYTNDAFNGQAPANAKFGKLVQYMITLPKEWADFPADVAAKSKYKEQMFIAGSPYQSIFVSGKIPPSSSSTPVEAQLSFSSGTTITDAIKKILETSNKFLELTSTERTKNGTGVTYRCIPTITSDDTTFVIHFDVYPHYMVKVDTETNPDANTSTLKVGSKNNVGSSSIVQNLVTYNYFFTGKNSHIIDLKVQYLPESAVALDTNLDLGQSRFKTNAEAGQTNQSIQKASESTKKKTGSYSLDLRGGDPVFFAYKSKEQKNNVVDQKTEHMSKDEATHSIKLRQDYTNSMAYMHFWSSLELDVTVRGNPNILRKYADRSERGGYPPHYSLIDSTGVRRLVTQKNAEANYNSLLAQKISTAKERYYAEYVAPRISKATKPTKSQGKDPLLDGPDVSVYPMFCRLNIRAPNVDSDGNFKDKEDMYTDEFFFNGPYMVLFIKSSFSDANFTQTLSVIPYLVSETIAVNDEPAAPPKNTGGRGGGGGR